jgi:hypothetical protein
MAWPIILISILAMGVEELIWQQKGTLKKEDCPGKE